MEVRAMGTVIVAAWIALSVFVTVMYWGRALLERLEPPGLSDPDLDPLDYVPPPA
jgi:hypothetical protein